jgi:hypothetical protein
MTTVYRICHPSCASSSSVPNRRGIFRVHMSFFPAEVFTYHTLFVPPHVDLTAPEHGAEHWESATRVRPSKLFRHPHELPSVSSE